MSTYEKAKEVLKIIGGACVMIALFILFYILCLITPDQMSAECDLFEEGMEERTPCPWLFY